MLNRHFSKEPGYDLLIRLACATPFIVIGMMLMVVGRDAGGYAVIFYLPLAAVFFCGAGLLIAPWLAERPGMAIGRFLYPDRSFDRAQPKYSIPEGKRARCEFKEALQAYEDILLEFPGDVRCYAAMMDIAVTDLREPDMAESIYQRARNEVKGRADLASLEEAYEEILSDYH